MFSLVNLSICVNRQVMMIPRHGNLDDKRDLVGLSSVRMALTGNRNENMFNPLKSIAPKIGLTHNSSHDLWNNFPIHVQSGHSLCNNLN